jgi:hypothetical protein
MRIRLTSHLRICLVEDVVKDSANDSYEDLFGGVVDYRYRQEPLTCS